METRQDLTPTRRALITTAVMTASLMQVLDTTIINVALPHMEGSLGATPDQVTWVLTSYLVAAAIFMPLTGYFTDRFGQKKYLLFSIGGFVLASALCGAAENITQIVVFRLLQGIFGAALVPLSQAILVDIFPAEQRGTAMAIWGIGVMVGPVLGPTLGGYLTDAASWRWNFYINVPVGVVCWLLTLQVVPETLKKLRHMDWPGLLLMSTFIAALQYFLDRGNQEDWFNSRGICIAAFLAVVCFLGFIAYNLNRQNARTVFDLRIFLDRNFAIACLIQTLFSLGMYGAMVILPLMLEGILNYPVLTSGLVMAPRGISAMICMLIVGRLISKVDVRKLVLSGAIISALGVYIGTYYNLNISPGWIIGPILFQGIGVGMVFVPLSAIAFSTLPNTQRSEAAGVFSLLRTVGGSIGISLTATLLERHGQISWNQLGGWINPFNTKVAHYLQPLHLSAADPQGVAILARLLHVQSQMVAFVDIYAAITLSFLLMIPIVFFLKKANKEEISSVPVGE